MKMGPFAQKQPSCLHFVSSYSTVSDSWQCLQRLTHIAPATALASQKSKVCMAHLIQPFWDYVISGPQLCGSFWDWKLLILHDMLE